MTTIGGDHPVEGVMHQPVPTFEEFVTSRGRDLWRTAWLLTGDSQKAEDLVQTTLAKCWRRWSSIAKDGSAEAYVRRAMLNTYTDWWRRKWNGERPTEVLRRRPFGSTGRWTSAGTPWPRFAGLPRGQRAVLVLRFYEDLAEAQTADPRHQRRHRQEPDLASPERPALLADPPEQP